jgi:hypothetical protein
MKELRDTAVFLLGIVTIIWSAWKLGFIPQMNETMMYWTYLVTGIVLTYSRIKGHW